MTGHPMWGPAAPAAPRRRWPLVVGVAVPSALAAAGIAAAVTAATLHPAEPAPAAELAPTTTTAAPAPAEAARQACAAYGRASDQLRAAVAAVAGMPPGMAVTDAAARTDPRWSVMVDKSLAAYRAAAGELRDVPSTTTPPALSPTLDALVASLDALVAADRDGDAATAGDAFAAASAADRAAAAQCGRVR